MRNQIDHMLFKWKLSLLRICKLFLKARFIISLTPTNHSYSLWITWSLPTPILLILPQFYLHLPLSSTSLLFSLNYLNSLPSPNYYFYWITWTLTFPATPNMSDIPARLTAADTALTAVCRLANSCVKSPKFWLEKFIF